MLKVFRLTLPAALLVSLTWMTLFTDSARQAVFSALGANANIIVFVLGSSSSSDYTGSWASTNERYSTKTDTSDQPFNPQTGTERLSAPSQLPPITTPFSKSPHTSRSLAMLRIQGRESPDT